MKPGPEPNHTAQPTAYDLLLASGAMAALLVLVTLADLVN